MMKPRDPESTAIVNRYGRSLNTPDCRNCS